MVPGIHTVGSGSVLLRVGVVVMVTIHSGFSGSLISNTLPICPHKLSFLSDYRTQFLIWKLWLVFLLVVW